MNNRLVTFCFIAQINDNSVGLTDFNPIFEPIVKMGLSSMNSAGITKGKSIIEIKNYLDEHFGLDIPIPFITNMLEKIAKDSRKEGDENDFILHNDGSFIMKQFIFSDFNDQIERATKNIEVVESIYDRYLESIDAPEDSRTSLIEFISQQNSRLSRLFAHGEDVEIDDSYIHQAQFLNFIKYDQDVFGVLRKIYLGSLITSYLELEIGHLKAKLEFLLDTNFLLGLLDLNSEESTHTCRKIVELCKKLKFRLLILPLTIEETTALINRTARNLNISFAQKQLDPESIYSACYRNGWGKTKLDKIAATLPEILEKEYGIYQIANQDTYKNKAKFNYTDLYKFYLRIRENNELSALHDTTAEVYVLEKRKKPVTDFLNSKCWFVSNTKCPIKFQKEYSYPTIIRSDTLVNILWLSNPSIRANILSKDIADMGLNRLITSTISESLPSTRVLKEFDQNLVKYASDNIDEEDCLRASLKLAEDSIGGFEELNKLAKKNSSKFIERLNELSVEKKKEDEEFKEFLTTIKDEIQKDIKENGLAISLPYRKRLESTIKWLIFILLLGVISPFIWVFSYGFEPTRTYFLVKAVIQTIVLLGLINIPLGRHWKTWVSIIACFVIVILGYLGLS